MIRCILHVTINEDLILLCAMHCQRKQLPRLILTQAGTNEKERKRERDNLVCRNKTCFNIECELSN